MDKSQCWQRPPAIKTMALSDPKLLPDPVSMAGCNWLGIPAQKGSYLYSKALAELGNMVKGDLEGNWPEFTWMKRINKLTLLVFNSSCELGSGDWFEAGPFLNRQSWLSKSWFGRHTPRATGWEMGIASTGPSQRSQSCCTWCWRMCWCHWRSPYRASPLSSGHISNVSTGWSSRVHQYLLLI